MTRQLLLLTAVMLVLVNGSPASAATSDSRCGPPPQVNKALDRLSSIQDSSRTEGAGRGQEVAALRSLLARFPDDVSVHRRYQDAAWGMTTADRDPLLDEYWSLVDARPDDPRFLYLYARVLLFSGGKEQEAREYMEKALEKDPDFKWAHLGLASIYRRPPARNSEKVRAHLERLMALCPEDLDAYDHVGAVDDPEFLDRSAAKLRALLGKEKDASRLHHYSTLWGLEFRIRPVSQHVMVRETVRRDLRRLRGVKKGIDESWFDVLKTGYELTGDATGVTWAEDQIIARFPNSFMALAAVQGRWMQANPRPKEGSQEELKSYAGALLEASHRWTRLWPDQPLPWFSRLSAIRDLSEVPASEAEITADGLLNSLEARPGTLSTWPPLRLQVAQVYLKHGVRVETVPGLVEKALQAEEKEMRRSLESDDPSDERKTDLEANLRHHYSLGRSLLVDAYLRMNQREKARQVVETMEAALSDSRPAESAGNAERRGYALRRAQYWEILARMFETENRKLDALTAYQNSLASSLRGGAPKEGDVEESADAKARRLWRELGGTDEGWQAWRSGREIAGTEGADDVAGRGWETLDRPLPDFELQDLNGRTWRLSDLKGKTTLVNVWATWCGPCRAELPYLQKLSERLSNREGVLLLTLNVDDNIGLIEPYVTRERFTFPVIPAHSYVEGIVEEMSIPRNWIVNAAGVLKMEQLGFGYEGDRWVDQALQALDTIVGP